jgi:hypothetical protein
MSDSRLRQLFSFGGRGSVIVAVIYDGPIYLSLNWHFLLSSLVVVEAG